MIYVRSALFNLAFYLWTGACTLLTLLTLPFPMRYGHYPADLWSWGMRKVLLIAGIRVKFRGLENLPEAPVLVASKHQSAWETTSFFTILPQAAVVVKKELFGIPVFGWYLRKMREIPVDRTAGASAVKKLIKTGKKALEDKRRILIFPEGTRTAVGAKGTYHPGVYALYSILKIPVVPVALNSGLFWPRRKFLKYPGTIIVEVLPQIPPGLDKKSFLRRLEDDIEAATGKLVREAKRKSLA